jgi:hypothetical protein
MCVYVTTDNILCIVPQIVPGFRVRIIPVLGTIPAIFGQVMASYVVTQLAGLDFQTEPVVNLDLDHYRILHQRLIEHEELMYGTAEQVLVLCFFLLCNFILEIRYFHFEHYVVEVFLFIYVDCHQHM